MTKHKKNVSKKWPVRPVLWILFGVGLLIAALLQGMDVTLLNPKGLIAGEQHKLMIIIVGIMLLIAVPTLTLLYFFAWKYRESNATATYDSNTRHGKSFVFTLWAIPTVVMLVLASVMWPATHRLEPRKAIATDAKPITIQVIAMRWKWLFIYPEQGIATVNFVQIPTNTPVQFVLTADEAPMSSFWIPHLGGQLYAMTGHVNPLNLMAEEPGDYTGSSAEINGAGFAGMKFTARASSREGFDLWVRYVHLSSGALSAAEYDSLLKPSENNQVAYYSSTDSDLYDKVLIKYNGSSDGHSHANHGAEY